VPVALFYLILRGLDTIEDDMTIALEEKDPLLRNFHAILEKDGWTYDGNGPDEKDRDLLVKFNNVITEFKKVKPAYRTIIKDITQKMGSGMADYATNAEHNSVGVNTVEDYDLYCHYVAGLVGKGLPACSWKADWQILHCSSDRISRSRWVYFAEDQYHSGCQGRLG
jgi:farnesyl-diphosphate farnesyltransferase